VIAVEFEHSADCFVAWKRHWSFRPEVFRVDCGHDDDTSCPWGRLALLNGGGRLPRVPRRLLNTRVLEAAARNFLDGVPDVVPLRVMAPQFFDQETAR